jgi:acetyl-CoA carboxylase biotin carboxyl carrier protein
VPPAFAPHAGSTPGAPDDSLLTIVSPMIGVFYRAPSPSDPNFVEVGDVVEIGQTVALVEAMKVFNEITAEVAGTVIEIKAQTAELVETGQVLMTIRP